MIVWISVICQLQVNSTLLSFFVHYCLPSSTGCWFIRGEGHTQKEFTSLVDETEWEETRETGLSGSLLWPYIWITEVSCQGSTKNENLFWGNFNYIDNEWVEYFSNQEHFSIIFDDNHNHLLKFPNNTLYMYKEFWLCKVEFTLMLLLEGFWGN